jgi:hypothetical protein
MTYAETALHGNYVTVRASARQWAAPAGPFLHRRDAEKYVDAASRAAQEKYRGNSDRSKLSFAGYGVARLQFKPGARRWEGKVNAEVGLQIDPATGYVRTG